jgi:hypothetical protein
MERKIELFPDAFGPKINVRGLSGISMGIPNP